jgi:hypothetical protein
MVWLAGLMLVLAVGATATVLIVSRGDDGTTSSNPPASVSASGPNESARGEAAATASGATGVTVGGPNEAARGAAAAGAVQRATPAAVVCRVPRPSC